MNEEQSREVLNHLLLELNNNGFNFVVEEVNLRLEDDFPIESIKLNSKQLLVYYLNESIDIISNHSNSNFKDILQKLNKSISGHSKVDRISVELLERGENKQYDLSELPDYSKLISDLIEIRNEISEAN